MGQPWGLSGPAFLAVYASGIGVMLLIPAAFRLLIGGMPGRRPPRQLDPYELGYLAGGPRRVAEMIIAEQAACGATAVRSRRTSRWRSDGSFAEVPGADQTV